MVSGCRSGSPATASPRQPAAGWAVADTVGTDGTDLLFQVELASFADQTVGVDTLLA
ncbi:MAG TPA: hypothetical protein VHG92_06435 [Afifellaceae bacterium]|nr:hypothetical protein [Afifellaceae bacterium]